LIPYNVNYYPENQNKLIFYFESYNTDTILGKSTPFLYTYYIERKEDLHKADGCSGFKKQITARVNPLLAQLDISKLESGNYFLVIEIRDQNNKVQLEKKWFFQRKNVPLTSPVAVSQTKLTRSTTEFFGNFNNADSLKMFVECLWPISNGVEKDWEINQAIKRDPVMMKNFIVDFWQKRTGDSLDPLKMWLDYYTQMVEVNKNYKCGKQKGYYTDRGRVALQYGKPSQRSVRPSEPNSYPYEIWQYYRIQDKATGQFFTNRRFVFVNRMIVDGCYTLIHSDMKGEIYNEKWQYEISKRDPQNNPNGTSNAPQSIYGSQADDLYNNPR
ncbi:MAG: GWxTD domain-containing protein, partial [Bacteroidia bacterium]